MKRTVFGEQSRLLKALAHARRLEIVQLLRDQELCVTEIYSMLDLPQANVSQHLMRLREAGVVTERKSGKRIYYQLAKNELKKVFDLLKVNGRRVVWTKDRVCGMRLAMGVTRFKSEYKNRTYYFCASGCEKKFKESPKKYVN